MNLSHELHTRIVEFLLSLPNMDDHNGQRALLYSAGLDHQLQNQITTGGSPDQFVRLLVPTLLDYGKLKDGRHALEAMLEAAKNLVGQDKHHECETLIREFREVRQSWPALVKLVLKADLTECNETTRQDAVRVLASILTLERDSIHVLQMGSGSQDIVIELPTGSAREFVSLFQTHPEKCVQLQQQFFVKEVILLSAEEYGPRFAVCQWERKECFELKILDRSVPLEQHYQALPLLREVKKERLPYEPGAPEKEEETKGGLRPVDILRWEEEQRKENITYEKMTLEQVFEDFHSVVKEAKSIVPRLVVLGPPGSGKTTLVQYLAWQAANRQLSESGRNLIPARVRLREWEAWAVKPADPERSLPEYLAERYKDRTPAPTTGQWRDWLQRGDVLLLLDGLDEISGNQSFLTALKTALDTFKECPMILTCRTVSFDQHQNLCLDFPVFSLAGLDENQRNAYIHAFPAEYPDRYNPKALAEQLTRTPQMQPLAANPLLLSIICYVVDDPHGVMLPARRGDLYAKAIEKLLTRPRRVEVTYPGGKSDLPSTRKSRILERVAFRLFVGMEQQRQLTFDEVILVDALTDGVKAEELANPADVADILLTDLTQNSGIFRGDAGQGYFFLHLAIQEFLTAKYLAKQVNEDQKGWKAEILEFQHINSFENVGEAYDHPWILRKLFFRNFRKKERKTWMVRELVDRKSWDPRWQEVITLLTGQLDNPTPLLEMLSQPKPTPTNPYGDDLFRHRLALAALCLPELQSEIRNSQPHIVGQITTDTFSLWWQHKRNNTDIAVPHLTSVLSALEQVNGQIHSHIVDHALKTTIIRLMTEKQNGTPLLSCLAGLLCDPERDVRTAAAEAVRAIGSAAATPEILSPLATLLRDPETGVRTAAAEAVRAIGSAAATPGILSPLSTLLRDRETDVRMAAARAVGDLGRAAATSEILGILAALLRDPETDVRWSAVRAVGGLGSAAATPDFLTAIVSMLRDPDWAVRRVVAEVMYSLERIAARPEILAALHFALLHDPDWAVRKIAARTMYELGSVAARPEIIGILAALLRDPDWAVRKIAARAVGGLGNAAATPEILGPLAALLRDPEWGVRWSAVRAVGDLGSVAARPEFLGPLAALLRDPEWDVQERAVEAVCCLGSAAATPEILAVLAALLRHPKKDVLRTAAYAVKAIGNAAATSEILGPLAALLCDPEWDVRSAAGWAVGSLGSSVITPEISDPLVALLRDQEGLVRETAARTVRDMGSAAATPEILAHLADLLCDPEWYVQETAARAVEAMGSAAATPKILNELYFVLWGSLNRDVWRAAAQAVRAMGRAAATPEILSLLANLLCNSKGFVWRAAAQAVRAMGRAAATPEILNKLFFILWGDPDGSVRETTAEILAHLMTQNMRIFERRGKKYEGRTVEELSALD